MLMQLAGCFRVPPRGLVINTIHALGEGRRASAPRHRRRRDTAGSYAATQSRRAYICGQARVKSRRSGCELQSVLSSSFIMLAYGLVLLLTSASVLAAPKADACSQISSAVSKASTLSYPGTYDPQCALAGSSDYCLRFGDVCCRYRALGDV